MWMRLHTGCCCGSHVQYVWVLSYIYMRHVTHKWCMSHIWMCTSHVIHMNESCCAGYCYRNQTCCCWTSRLTISMQRPRIGMFCVRNMTHSCVTWPIHVCDKTDSYVWRVPFLRADQPSRCIRHVLVCFACGTWFHMGHLTHLYGCHDSSIRVTYLIHTSWPIVSMPRLRIGMFCVWNMIYPYVWHGWFIRVTCVIQTIQPTISMQTPRIGMFCMWNVTHS